MSAKSTSIGDLPNVESTNSNDDEETMMVNSILKEIENDDNIDNSEQAINYTIDTSQIPPKINEQIPTKEMIQETTNEIFNQPQQYNIMSNEEPIEEIKKEDLKDFLNEDKPIEKNIETLTNIILNKGKYALIIFILFIILSSNQLNKLIVNFLPKMRIEGVQVSLLGNILKGIILALLYFGLSFII
jgi:hypothetical protein